MKVLFSLACAGAIAAAAPASAADLLGPLRRSACRRTPGRCLYEVGSGWYVRGDLGVSFDDGPASRCRPLGAAARVRRLDVPRLFRTDLHSTDFTGGVGAGYRFNDYLRFDATWDYRTGPGGSSQSTVVCPYGLTGLTSQVPPNPLLGYLYNTSNTCIGRTSLKQHNNTFLGNAYVDLGTYYGFTPYIGGGLGFNINTMSGSLAFNETANGQPYAADLTPTGAFPQVWVNPYGNADRAATQHRLRAANLESLVPFDDLHLRLGALRRARVSAHSERDARRRLSLSEQRHGQHPHQSANRHEVQGKQLVATDPGGHSLHPAVGARLARRRTRRPRRDPAFRRRPFRARQNAGERGRARPFTPDGPCVTVSKTPDRSQKAA